MQGTIRTMLAAACAAGFVVDPAIARVGVTSVADGQPLGQPPAQAERVLRVGIDVQANERVTTKADDRAHVVFLDGTALTVGPNSVLVIDKYVFDPDRKTGDMAISATRGVFRFVGGSISKNSEVTVKTPSATIGIRGGIANITVSESGGTSAQLLYGDAMRVTSQGVTSTATRGGSEINVPINGPPTTPAILPPGKPIATAGLEKPASTVPSAIATRAPVAAAVDQNTRQAATVQQTNAQTRADTTTAPQTTTAQPAASLATTAGIDAALDRSGFAEKNSRIQPGSMKLALQFRPEGDGPGSQGQARSGPQRLAGKGLSATPAVAFRPPPILVKPQIQNQIRTVVANQNTRQPTRR